MQCYACGQNIPSYTKVCPSCGRSRSKMGYIPFWGVIGGIVGSLIGFTLFEMIGALAGGLLGIVVCECGSWMIFRSRGREQKIEATTGADEPKEHS